jgi:biotin synthase
MGTSTNPGHFSDSTLLQPSRQTGTAPHQLEAGQPGSGIRQRQIQYAAERPVSAPSGARPAQRLPMKDPTPPSEPTRWSVEQVAGLFEQPFNDLLYRAQSVHRRHFDPNTVQISTLLSIKTGGCPENCGYCSQSAHHKTGVQREALMSRGRVLEAANRAKQSGATRFCMGAAWRGPNSKELSDVLDLVKAVRELGMETCVTLGMLRPGQAEQLKAAGLDYYNHNLDTARDFYGAIVTTHHYQDRLDTLEQVRKAGIKVCCGGIVGMGESRLQRAALIAELASLDPPPESVPINLLVPIAGTPLSQAEQLDPIEFVRTIAVARVTMPTSVVRLSAGRATMADSLQALCFLAGANSIFYGDRLLTTGNPSTDSDRTLFDRLGLQPTPSC